MALPPKFYQFLVGIFASLGSFLYGYDLTIIAEGKKSASIFSLDYGRNLVNVCSSHRIVVFCRKVRPKRCAAGSCRVHLYCWSICGRRHRRTFWRRCGPSIHNCCWSNYFLYRRRPSNRRRGNILSVWRSFLGWYWVSLHSARVLVGIYADMYGS
jgi:hypothetical protein